MFSTQLKLILMLVSIELRAANHTGRGLILGLFDGRVQLGYHFRMGYLFTTQNDIK